MAEEGQNVFRPAGQTTCIHHQEKVFDFHCEKCKTLICSKCVTTIHKGHDLSDLSDVTRVYKTEIQRFVDDTERNKDQETQQKIRETEDDLRKNDEYYDNLAREVKLQAGKLKQEIDVLTAETLSLYQQMKDENARILREYKQCLEKAEVELGDYLEQCNSLLQEASDIQICHARQEMKNRDVIFPPKPTLSDVTFCPTTGYRGSLEQAFGKTVTTSGQSGRPTTTRPSQGYNLLMKTKIQQKFHPGGMVACIQSTGNDRAWTLFVGATYIELYSPTGEVLNMIQFNTCMTDISVSPISHNVWASGSDGSIMECIDGSPVVRFHPYDRPLCLCVTKSNHVLVGAVGGITKFSPQGHVLLNTYAPISGIALVAEAHGIAECCVTGNVAVVDWPTRKYNVLVMDKDFHGLFRYQGTGTNTLFNPCDVTFDIVGNIIIADYNNNCVILLSGKGPFIKVIHRGTANPAAVSIDRDNVLWVTTSDSKVKRLQYCVVCSDHGNGLE